MKASQLFLPTLKEVPKDAEVLSHQLMLRAGMIRKVASGIYTYLPLGLRALRKFEGIIREELDAIGCQEVFMPSVIPESLWQSSGRWTKYGKELLRITDRHGNEFCYGPTHEEVITDLVGNHLKSSKQLPMTFYQIQTKFRDEIRPRFGLMRAREFCMKDAYSFHVDEACLGRTYEAMVEAYRRIFSRSGLSYKIVEADTGAIGGSGSAEFMVTADTGEDEILEAGEYAANVEAAPNQDPGEGTYTTDEPELLETPGVTSIEALASFMGCKDSDLIKTMVYRKDGKDLVAVLVRGDHEVNVFKLVKFLGCDFLEPAEREDVLRVFGASFGSLGPKDLKEPIPIYADMRIKTVSDPVVGANRDGFHYSHVVPGRDFQVDGFGDLTNARSGDVCPVNGETYRAVRGIEVGHVFKLNDRYSGSMKAEFLDSDGASTPYQMGCYGIGVGRTVAAAIEQCHDDKGIVWPTELAPFQVVVIATNTKKDKILEQSTQVYETLKTSGLDVLFDDRGDSAGAKFKDAELIGIPVQVIVGMSYLKEGKLEVKRRRDQDLKTCAPDDVLVTVQSLL